MDPNLLEVASEVLTRMEPFPPPGNLPRFLASGGGRCLLGTSTGLVEVGSGELPMLELAHLVDHTLLKAEAREEDVLRLCGEAMDANYASVCVNPLWVETAARALQGRPTRVCTVAGFPLGATTSTAKAEEARIAVDQGAQEVDLVLAVGRVRSGAWEAVARDLEILRQAVPRSLLKLILETCLLTEAEKRKACALAVQAGFDFVKTSTGFSTGGATIADVVLMREVVGSRCGVKASGGIRTYDEALALLKAGATRLGLSASRVVCRPA